MADYTTSLVLFLDYMYPVPDPLDTLESYRRFTHEDLRAITLPDLHRELARLEQRLLFDDKPHPWLFERREILEKVIAGLDKAADHPLPDEQIPSFPLKGDTHDHARPTSLKPRTIDVTKVTPWYA